MAALLLLTAVAGATDAIGYLGLQRVFAANMTGNTVQLALAAVQADGALAARTGVALLGFVAGAGGGAAFLARRPDAARAVFALEGIALALTTGYWWVRGPVPDTAAHLVLLAGLAAAMGLQSAAAYHLGVAGVATTYVTGVLVGAVTGLAGNDGQGRGHLRLADWAVYLLGAAGGGVAARRWATVALLPPLLVLVVAVTLLPGEGGARTGRRAG